jgi:drug/metabolite transporter (DMT)-like permease
MNLPRRVEYQALRRVQLERGAPGVRARSIGMLFASIAVLFWSFGSSLIYLGARQIGTWQFVAIASFTAGILQLICRRIFHGEIQSALRLPWRLWALPLLCFVTYGLVWPRALADSTTHQVGGVNLINYLWPVLTVLFSACWVPGVRLTPRLLLALTLAVAGLACANFESIRPFFSRAVDAPESHRSVLLPYGFAFVAALTWAVYSAILARWRDWAGRYVTSPIGFLCIATIASAVLFFRDPAPSRIGPSGFGLTVLYGLGPLGAGYLLWELALSRSGVQSLSVIAAATPVLSTILLCCFLKKVPGLELVAAAALVSAGVVLSVKT